MYENDLIPDPPGSELDLDIIPEEKKPLVSESGEVEMEEYDDNDDYDERVVARRPRAMVGNVMELFVGLDGTKRYIADRAVGIYLRNNYTMEAANSILDAISGAVLIFTKGYIGAAELRRSLGDVLRKYSPGDAKLEKMVEASIYKMGR